MTLERDEKFKVEARWQLSMAHFKGRYFKERNFKQASKYLILAAKNGHTKAQSLLQQWSNPVEVPVDDAIVSMQFALGYEFLRGDVVEAKEAEAFLKAAHQSGTCPQATLLLSRCNAWGEYIIDGDFDQACELIDLVPPKILKQSQCFAFDDANKINPRKLYANIQKEKKKRDFFQRKIKKEADKANAPRQKQLHDLLEQWISSSDVRHYLLEYVTTSPTMDQVQSYHPPAPHACPQCCSGWLTIEDEENSGGKIFIIDASCDVCNFVQHHDILAQSD